MTATVDRFDLTELAADFEKAGIKLDLLERGPLGEYVVALEVLPIRDRLRIWPGAADLIEWSVCKKFHQAVVTITEERRDITLSAHFRDAGGVWPGAGFEHTVARQGLGEDSKDNVNRLTKSAYKQLVRRTINGANVALPAEPVKQPLLDVVVGSRGPYSDIVSATVVVTLPKTRTTFLMGQDGDGYFISQLPKHVDTVKEAHAVLRPKNISKDAIRVGEWFFDPVTDKKLIAQLNRVIADSYYGLTDTELEDDSKHMAVTHVELNKKRRYP